MKLEYEFVEFYVGDAKIFSEWHEQVLGFRITGVRKGSDGIITYLLTKGMVKILVTGPVNPTNHEIHSFLRRHGNGIKRIGIKVRNLDQLYDSFISNGGIPLDPIQTIENTHGIVLKAKFKVLDENEIEFIDDSNYSGSLPIGFEYLKENRHWEEDDDSYIDGLDHITYAMRFNELEIWENYLNKLMNGQTVQRLDGKDKLTNQLGMMMNVLESGENKINSVLVCPLNPFAESQINTFLKENYGAGIQHVALSSTNIFHTIKYFKSRGVSFTEYPQNYFDNLAIAETDQISIEKLRNYGVLCEKEGDGFLLQTFLKPLGQRTTFFYEIVQRVNNYNGFGINNIKSLFEAIEEQVINT